MGYMDRYRIINEEETEEIAEDDYVLIDSATLGTRKILASNLEEQE